MPLLPQHQVRTLLLQCSQCVCAISALGAPVCIRVIMKAAQPQMPALVVACCVFAGEFQCCTCAHFLSTPSTARASQARHTQPAVPDS